jgi:hypothetical protein
LARRTPRAFFHLNPTAAFAQEGYRRNCRDVSRKTNVDKLRKSRCDGMGCQAVRLRVYFLKRRLSFRRFIQSIVMSGANKE